MKRLVLVALAGLLAAGCQSDKLARPLDGDSDGILASNAYQLPAPEAHGLRAMAYNVYLGTDLTPLLEATGEAEFIIAGVRAYAELQQTDFPARAGRIADQIAKVRPDVLGLEELAIWSVSAPYVPGGPPIAPFEVQYDFLQLVLDALQARGLHYTAAAVDTTTDVAAPVATAFSGGIPTAFALVRFQDRDAVLVRAGVAFSDPQHGKYQTFLPLDLLGTQTGIYNGWSSVRATVNGQTFRFVATHLNAEYGPVNNGQAQELLALLQSETDPVVLVGDFNTGPGVKPAFAPTYDLFTGAGFTDLWPVVHPTDPGLTNGPNDGVGALDANGVLVPYASLDFTTRVDLVLLRGARPNGMHAAIFGSQPDDRTAAGLWPSDHAAVGMVFQLPTNMAAGN